MKKNLSVGGYFVPIGVDILNFKSANGLKGTVLLLFYILLGCWGCVDIMNVFDGDPIVFVTIYKDGFEPEYLFFFWIFILPVIWLFLPPIKVDLNRAQGKVHYRKGKLRFDFPWEQVTFNHQWIPTKTGGSTLFTLVVLPPYPDDLMRLVEKKAVVPPGQQFIFKLGSFDVKGPEHGQAIFGFLDAWMKSREPAKSLFSSKVESHFGI